MVAAKKMSQKQITNRRAQFDYSLEDDLIVGIVLTGSEVKNLRMGHAQLKGSYITIRNNELYLVNFSISGTNGMPIDEQSQTRDRKLLAKRKEINKLIEAKQNGRTIVPLSIFNQGRYIKIKIAIGKGKKNYDKRETIKKRQFKRNPNQN
jgi:SsrA-binding protein